MKTRPRRFHRSSRLDQLAPAIVALEDRQLLSGNVGVQFDGPDLIITGDKSANEVQVLYDGVDVIVRGLNGTTINGAAGDFVAVPASNLLPGNLVFDLQKGNDVVYVSGGVNVTNNLLVTPGAGHDRTVIKDAIIADTLFVGAPLGLADDPGNDSVLIENTNVDTASVATGTGHDNVILMNVVATEDVIALVGSGNDGVISNISAAANFIVSAGAGNDFVVGEFQAGGFSIDLEAGNDVLFMTNVDQTDPARQASVNLGQGNDRATFGIGSASFVSFLSVAGSTGVDYFFLVPGALTPAGLLIADVESTAPYLSVEDPKVQKLISATLKRLESFSEFVMTLP